MRGKSNEISETGKAAICFIEKFKSTSRLVGNIKKVPEDISDKYYQTRSRGSRIGLGVKAIKRIRIS